MIKQLFSTEAVLVSNFPPQITRTPMSGVLSLSQAILLLLKKKIANKSQMQANFCLLSFSSHKNNQTSAENVAQISWNVGNEV